ncbi:hypothetical protein ACFV4Q_10050 [Streptomyces nojiriensis]|uniref:hypothetical protein n=1 Tax=Streptomyces nojiriensis TaxID=66374 RepID=UPI003654A11B
MLEAFRVAAETGVDVPLVVFDHPDNRKAVAAAGIEDLVVTWRTRATIPHNKFVIASHDCVPRSVWTGSTNITENGIFGQSNAHHGAGPLRRSLRICPGPAVHHVPVQLRSPILRPAPR